MKKLLITSVLCASLLFSGCGTLINGNTQRLAIKATPADAKIKVFAPGDRLIAEGKGSLKSSLKRGKRFFTGAEYEVRVEAKGYKPTSVLIEPIWSSPSLVGNAVGLFFFGVGFIGGLVDGAGPMWDLEPDNGQDLEHLNIQLRR